MGFVPKSPGSSHKKSSDKHHLIYKLNAFLRFYGSFIGVNYN